MSKSLKNKYQPITKKKTRIVLAGGIKLMKGAKIVFVPMHAQVY